MKKIIRNSILIIIIIGIAAIYSFGTWGKNIYVQTASSGDNKLTNELIGNIEIAQTFLSPYNGLNGVKIKMLRVGAEAVEGYSWRVCNDEGEVLAEGEIGESELTDSTFMRKKFLTFKIPEQKDSKGKEYILYINGADVSKEGCLQAYVADGNHYAKQLTIDEKNIEGALVLKMDIMRFNLETFIVFLGLVAYVFVFFKFMYKLFR
ncbi:hypothetical protein [Faecalicatena contorta]|uniref:Uncharacterized protein n=1 Tax=Faecalicatena contorta TaxID=39482 RepID=A0A315ZU08_9FIRM|nr:hypothetical protein [Faecalicatena contorta]PWJ48378.1 hypothetical protein A8805_11249 [Faecalicatena contorta]SUQ15401.1 hypothetical protein SAMN05216529_11249 [Faecalicatena contorta]